MVKIEMYDFIKRMLLHGILTIQKSQNRNVKKSLMLNPAVLSMKMK